MKRLLLGLLALGSLSVFSQTQLDVKDSEDVKLDSYRCAVLGLNPNPYKIDNSDCYEASWKIFKNLATKPDLEAINGSVFSMLKIRSKPDLYLKEYLSFANESLCPFNWTLGYRADNKEWKSFLTGYHTESELLKSCLQGLSYRPVLTDEHYIRYYTDDKAVIVKQWKSYLIVFIGNPDLMNEGNNIKGTSVANIIKDLVYTE
jgi:hypothetical protein